jgi:hypothetical protein
MKLYADARIEFFDAGADTSRIQEALRMTSRLQAELWVFARDEARARPTTPSGLFAMALNDLFDISESRTAGLEIRVPTTVWVALYVVAALACGSLGFGSGLMNRRLMLPIVLLPLLMSLILTLLLDLDHPRRGLIRTSQESILRFRDSLP